MKYTAFISHSTKDWKAIRTIREHLERCGYSCFASERDLRHNANWQTQLVEAMDASDLLIYVHSKNSNESAEVSREINYFADKCHRPILVYRLDDVRYNNDRAYYLQSINYFDSLDRPGDGLDQLVLNIKNTLEGIPYEGYERAPGKRRKIFRRVILPILGVLLLAGGYLGFHALEKKKAEQLQSESSAILAQVEGWIAQEDSLEFVLPGIDRAEELYIQSTRFHTVSAPEMPDFQEIRDRSREALAEIRTRRVNTVKALYEPLKYASRDNSAASRAMIVPNIEKIHRLDSLLGLPADEDVELIMNKITTE